VQERVYGSVHFSFFEPQSEATEEQA
jgi:hypothetical protein